MEAQCSCSACSSLTCLTKHPLCIYGDKKEHKAYLFYNKVDKETPSYDDYTLKEKVSKEAKVESLNLDSKKLKETSSVCSCDENLKVITHDNFNDVPSSRNSRQSAAKLSAQIMNVPLKDLEITFRHGSGLQTNISKLTPFDIFEKIKEVYKACSCKVCECIVGKSQKNEWCDCKPCDCDDCKNFKKKVKISNTFTSLDVTRAESDYLRYERSLIHAFTKQGLTQKCKCKPCECHECSYNLSAPCSCEARYSSKKYQKLVVAAVESDNTSHQDCTCSPCNCAECSHHTYGLSSNLRREMSTEINRPEGCHCEACLNEACLPAGANTCSCERRTKIMRKPVQRDTDFDIHRSIISQPNPCRQDLIAMFTAISKKYPDDQIKETRSEMQNKEDSGNTVSLDNNRKLYDTTKYATSPLDRHFVPKKSSLKTEKTSPYLERLSEIKAISKFSSNNACRCSPCDCMDCDNLMVTCTGDVCDCTHCKCERCISKDEVIYPIKKGEKLTPAIFEKKMNRSYITLCGEENQNTDDNNTSLKTLLASRGHYRMDLPKNVLVDECDKRSFENYTKIEQQLCQKVSTKLKNIHRAELLKDSPQITCAFNRNIQETIQTSNSKLTKSANYPISNYTDSNPQLGDKYQSKKCNDSDYLHQFPNKEGTYLKTIRNLNKFPDIKHKNINVLSKNNTQNFNVSLNFHNRYAKNLVDVHAISSRSIKNSEQKSGKVNYDEYFAKQDNVLSINESSQCIIIEKNNISGKEEVTQTVNQNKVLISRMRETNAVDCKRSVHYSNSVEKVYKGINEIDSEKWKIDAKSTTINNFDLDDDYRRVQKTIKDARAFSLHLMQLLEQYEKANREFESVSQKLTHSNKTYMVNHMVSIPQNVSHKGNVNEIKPISENSSTKGTYKVSFDNEPTKESNSILSFDSRHHQINGEKKVNITMPSMNSYPDFLTDDLDMIRNSRSIVKLIQDSSKHIVAEDSGIIDDNIVHSEPIQKKIYNDNSLIEFKHNSSNTFSNNNSDLISDSINYEENVCPTNEANSPTNLPLHYLRHRRNMKKMSKNYNKMYKQAVIVTKRKKLFVPTFAKCSITTETSNDLVDQICANSPVPNRFLKDKLNKLSIAFTESVVNNDAFMVPNDSANTINTTANMDHIESHSETQHQDIDGHREVTIKSPLETKQSNAKKTVGKTAENEVTVGVFRKQSLDKGIKEAVEAIKQASMTWESNYLKAHHVPEGRHENLALVKLHLEVKKLLEMPILQKCENYSQNKISDANGNVHKCETLKVSFLAVRKLSDSSIVVKWQVPKVLENVQGYEVLVNGRAVQRIQDNMCYESVLSDLPRSNKVLVTVRTVTKRLCSSGHSPTATVVYRPRPTGVYAC